MGAYDEPTQWLSAELDLRKQKRHIQSAHPGADVLYGDIIAILAVHIVITTVVSWFFTAAFFADLFWPERPQTAASRLKWKIGALVALGSVLADAVAFNVSSFFFAFL